MTCTYYKQCAGYEPNSNKCESGSYMCDYFDTFILQEENRATVRREDKILAKIVRKVDKK